MKIVNQVAFKAAQKSAREALQLKMRGEYYDFDWAVAVILLRKAYGIVF